MQWQQQSMRHASPLEGVARYARDGKNIKSWIKQSLSCGNIRCFRQRSQSALLTHLPPSRALSPHKLLLLPKKSCTSLHISEEEAFHALLKPGLSPKLPQCDPPPRPHHAQNPEHLGFLSGPSEHCVLWFSVAVPLSPAGGTLWGQKWLVIYLCVLSSLAVLGP